MNFFFKTKPWVKNLLKAYFTILFPQCENHQCYYHAWYNIFDGFYYNAIGLRYDTVSKVYRDLYANEYHFDPNQQIYWNRQGIIFDRSGWSYLSNKRWAIDFFENYYQWCPLNHGYQYSGFWSSRFSSNNSVKTLSKPVTGRSTAARVWLFKNDPFGLPILKGGLTVLVVSAFITVNPIEDLSMISQRSLESKHNQAVAQYSFKKLETIGQIKGSKTQPLAKPSFQKQTRVSASVKQISKGFSFDNPASTITVSSPIDPRRYNTVNLLQDLAKCLDVHTKTFLDEKQKQNLDVDPSLKTGIRKLYKQLDIATNLARENQEYLKQFGSATQSEGIKLVTRLNKTLEKRAFDKKGNTIQKNKKKNLNLNQTVAQQLREYGRFPLFGIQTLVTIKNDPQAALTKVERRQIDQEFAKTPYGEKMKAISSIRAHILSDSWSTVPNGKDSQKVLSYKLPFNRFPAPIINNEENLVITPAFLEKLLDSFKNVETGVFPTFLQKKFESNPAWTPEKNYIIANAFYDDFYLPALSQHEKKYALEIRKQIRKSKNNSQN